MELSPSDGCPPAMSTSSASVAANLMAKSDVATTMISAEATPFVTATNGATVSFGSGDNAILIREKAASTTISPTTKATTMTASASEIPTPRTPSTLPLTHLKSGPAHWDMVKSRLLAASSTDRPGALRMLQSMREKNLFSLYDSDSIEIEPRSESESKPTLPASGEHSLMLSALLPALSKILVSPVGKASQMLDASKEKGKQGKKKGRKDKSSESTVSHATEDKDEAALNPKKKEKQQSKSPPAVPPCHVPPSANPVLINCKVRHAALLLLDHISGVMVGKLPHEPEIFRRNAPLIMGLSIHVLVEDYEENAMLANGLFMKVLRGYKLLGGEINSGAECGKGAKEGAFGPGKESTRVLRECQVFLEFLAECYKGWSKKGNLEKMFELNKSSLDESAVDDIPYHPVKAVGSSQKSMAASHPITLSEIETDNARSAQTTPQTGLPPSRVMSETGSAGVINNVKSSQSFRLLADMPLTVMLLVQLYPRLLRINVPALVPPMVGFLKLSPPQPPIRMSHDSDLSALPSRTPAKTTPTSNAFTPSLSTPQVGMASTPATKTIPGPNTLMTTPQTSLQAMKTPVPTPHEEVTQYEMRRRHHRAWTSLLLSSQTKALSFITHLLRTTGSSSDLQEFQDEDLATCILHLLRNCPPSASALRRELLSSTRHIFATELRRGFYKHVDAMLDERLLIGNHPRISSSGREADYVSSGSIVGSSSMQSLGYSILAEFIHHVRSKLTPAQLSKAVRIFSRVLHDDTPLRSGSGLGLQITSAKLLVHLVDLIFHNRDPNPQVGRDLLYRILNACVHKFDVVKEWVPTLLGAADWEMKDKSIPLNSDYNLLEKDQTMLADVGDKAMREYLFGGGSYTSPSAMLRDVQILLRPLIHGTKTIFWCISSYSHQREKERQRASLAGEEVYPLPAYALTRENDEVSSAGLKMTRGERELVEKFVRVGLPCLRAFKVNASNLDIGPSLLAESGKSMRSRPNPRHREVLESFAVSFTSLESYNFRMVVAPNLHFMMDEMEEEEDCILMFSHLLLTTGKPVSYEFSEVLFVYLMENLHTLGQYEEIGSRDLSEGHAEPADPSLRSIPPPPSLTKRAQNLSRVFSLAFSSLMKYPRNEAALLPHLQMLVKECVQRSTEGHMIHAWPGPYLNTIRELFRTMAGGNFDRSYKELLPLVPTMLNGLFRFYKSTQITHLRFVLIELCLTVPSRLSALLPHLPLLVQLIVPALQSETGDLINLGLRTLEFWVDNLHPDYLFPILSQEGSTLCELMVALISHLQPAPYPYGLLCMRLVGKLGGASRLFLREMIDYVDVDKRVRGIRGHGCGLSMYCEWQCTGPEGFPRDEAFLLPFPLTRAVEVLRCVAEAPTIVGGASIAGGDDADARQSFSNPYHSKDFGTLLSMDARNFDLNSYSAELMEETKKSQSRSAFILLRAALAAVVDISEGEGKKHIAVSTTNPTLQRDDNDMAPRERKKTPILTPFHSQIYTGDFKQICCGLFAAASHKDLRNESILLLKGLSSHIFFLLASNRGDICRIDRDGCSIDTYHGEGGINHDKYDSQNHLSEGKLQPLKPFGCFRLSGPLEGGIDPFVFNESLVEAFGDCIVRDSHVVAAVVMKHVTDLFLRVNDRADDGQNERDESLDKDSLEVASKGSQRIDGSDDADIIEWGDVFFENLLSQLCQACFRLKWNHRLGPMSALFSLMQRMGSTWSKRYEVEILHTAMFLLKDTPDGIAAAGEGSIRFFLRVTWLFFGGPISWEEPNPLVRDVLCPMMESNTPVEHMKGEEVALEEISVKEASLTLILSEITSTKSIVRFAVRHALRLITRDSDSMETVLVPHVNSLKRLLFPKVLRILPLPNQVAIVEACAFIIDKAPRLIPIEDQNLLAFLSELLKMISIADGEFPDPNFGGVVLIDKNGYAVDKYGDSEPTNHSNKSSAVRPSSLFLRKTFVAKDMFFGGRIQIPAELSPGVQLRVSTLLLFRGLIRGFPNEFFDADSESKVGNIRPHVVALLFRSLISSPPEVVSSSASALHDALVLSMKDEAPAEGGTSSSAGQRLPRELIQSCIRPILLHLRDCSKLTIPLLRGLSRLLGLLSSWFNKTLGEKLLEHLNKFTEPDKIIATQLWKPGEEPLIAAAVMDLFALLPQASHFVESLVKHTIRLESVLPRYKPCLSTSPFRAPLAKYLSRHCASAAGFFLEEHRLCNPLYSSLFQDILKRDDTHELRMYLSESSNSLMLLNVCFDRPLSMIRSEKASGSEGKLVSLNVYGINEWSSASNLRKLELARQDIDMKRKIREKALEEEAKAQKSFQSTTSEESKPTDVQVTLQTARETVERAKRELDTARNDYARDVSSLCTSRAKTETATNQRFMTVSALELQHQGFKIIEILMSLDPQYLEIHHDVQRALRWLWRSRGRHYRLLHQDEIPPRYHCESLTLAKFLVSYAEANPVDTDVLFDLIRIFLQPFSGVDFSFIKHFLLRAVSDVFSPEQKRQILKRFCTLLSSEGSEETKIISAQLLVIPMLKQSASRDIFCDSSVKMFIQPLINDGSYGSKLSCEHLKIVSILLERVAPEGMADYRKDVLRYIWAILKGNDQYTKYHGYLAVCRFISVFDTPSKVILQVYRSLIRDTSGRGAVLSALDILIPVLHERLGDGEIEVLLKYTTKVIREEENSVPQMARVWEAVTRHPQLYSRHRSTILPHMLQSLSLIGRQKTPSEIRKLSVALAKLAIEWGGVSQSAQSPKGKDPTSMPSLDQKDVDDILNILIRLSFVNAESKPSHLNQPIQTQVLSLVRDIVSSQKKCKILSTDFQCACSQRVGARGKCTDTTQQDDKGSECNEATLHLCSEIFLILLRHDPENDFIDDNACALIVQCFNNATSLGEKIIYNLKEILVHLLADAYASIETKSSVNAMLESALMEGNDEKAYLSVSIMEKVWETNSDIIDSFATSLVTFSERLANHHIQEAIDQASHSSSIQQIAGSGQRRYLSATPTLGIFEAACGMGFKPPSRAKDIQISTGGFKNQIAIEPVAIDVTLESLILSMRLLSSSGSLFVFSRTRRIFMKTLSLILESSNSVPVLMTAVSIIGTWLKTGVPLTQSERNGYLWQLVLLNSRGLSETSSQALADAVGCIVLTAYGYSSAIVQDFPFGFDSSVQSCNASDIWDHIIEDDIFQKLFSTCLLSANPYVRSLSLNIFSSRLNSCILAHEKMTTFAVGNGFCEGDFADTVVATSVGPEDILRCALQVDFECLGKRLWTSFIADVLLASCKVGGVSLGQVEENVKHSFLGYLRLNCEGRQSRQRTEDLVVGGYDDGIYFSFVKAITSEKKVELCGRGRCIAAIRDLARGDVETCQTMLELCFQATWQYLPSDQARSALIEPLGSILSKPFHSQFLPTRQRRQMNSVQSTLQLLAQLRPMPAVDPFLLQSLGASYNGCNEALAILENQFVALKRAGKAQIPYQMIKAIQKCYECLGERDVCMSISSTTSSFAGTRFALSLDMYGSITSSTRAYLTLIERADRNDMDVLPVEREIELWEQRWVAAHREMSQWSVVDEFASSTGDASLQLECAWKTHDWNEAKSLLEFPSVVASLEEGDSLMKMIEVYLAIHDGKLEEVEGLHAQTAQLCLNQWQVLPSLRAGANFHDTLFYQFQRLVELRETSQIMVDASTHSARRTIPDLKSLLSAWRHRLPNTFDHLCHWNDIFLWRCQVFKAIASNFAWSDQNTVATLHDRPFACISLGRAARKQGLKEVAAFSLNSLADCAMDVEYAFLRMREQIVHFQHSSSVEDVKGGLNMVNSTHLQYFDSRQKAELFRLKASFFKALNEKPKSNQAYCHAVQICPTFAKAWIDWGRLCASLAQDTRIEASEEKADSKELTKKTNLYLVQAMGCFLEAVRCDPSEESRENIPYCLSMLANDGPSYGNLCRTFETRSAVLPAWVWLPWMPQLLSSLCRVEAQSMKAVLVGMLKDHPQALYYSLRSFYLERRDIERSKAKAASSTKGSDLPSSSRLAEELMSNLRKAHPVLWIRLENVLEELIVRFRPSYETELLHSLSTLLKKVSAKPEQKPATYDFAACTKTLEMLGSKFFPEGCTSRKSVNFYTRYASSFKRDFIENTDGKYRSRLVENLQKWKSMLELDISQVPSNSILQQVSPSLSWFSSQAPDLWAGACESKFLSQSNSQHDAHPSLDNLLYRPRRSSALMAAKASSQVVLETAKAEGLGGHTGGGAAVIEIPGQYPPTSSNVFDSRPFPELHAKLVRFHQTVELTSSSSKHHLHRITMIGSDGKAYHFFLQISAPYSIRTDERTAQINLVVRKALGRDTRACRKRLSTRPSVVVPIAQRMSLGATKLSHQSLESVLSHVQGGVSNKISLYFQKHVNSHSRSAGEIRGERSSRATEESKLDAYHEICNNFLPTTMLSSYMMDVIPCAEHLFQFRKVFASQLAVNSLLQYALSVVERTPNRFIFCNATGKVLTHDFRSQYNQGLLEKQAMPFRMTRNIVELMGPFLLEGVFVPSFAAASSAMHSKRTVLGPILHLLLRDDVMAWYISKSSTKSDHKLQEVERQLSDRVWSNVRFVQDRFEECSPREVKDAAVEVECSPDPIDIKVRLLVDAATSAEKLSTMPPAYQAWL